VPSQRTTMDEDGRSVWLSCPVSRTPLVPSNSFARHSYNSEQTGRERQSWPLRMTARFSAVIACLRPSVSGHSQIASSRAVIRHIVFSRARSVCFDAVWAVPVSLSRPLLSDGLASDFTNLYLDFSSTCRPTTHRMLVNVKI